MSGLSAKLRYFSQALSIAAMGVAGLVLIGWSFGITSLKSILPGLVAMNPVTALSFALAGASLLLAHVAPGRNFSARLSVALGGVVAVAGTLKLLEYAFGWHLGFDQLLFRSRLGQNQMAPTTAFNFLLLGGALVLLGARNHTARMISQGLAAATALVSFLVLTGYLYNIQSFYRLAAFIPMALHTAACFAALGLGVLWARPEFGLMATITSDTTGGVVARRLLPAAVLVPIAIGWLRLEGQRAGLYDTEFGVAAFALVNVVVLALLVWWTAALLARADADRKRAEAELDRYFTLSLDMFCIAGFDGFFRRLNPAWERVLGWRNEELRAKPYLDFVHPDDLAATMAEAKKLADGADTVGFENRYLCRDGSYRWLLWKATAVMPLQVVYAAARDITARKEAEAALAKANAQLEATNKELEAFSYSVSHDLRAPLRSIDGFSRVLLEDYADKLDAEGQDHLQRVRAASQRMGRLIDDLLNLSRLTRTELRREPVDLTPMAKSIAAELQQRDPHRQAEFAIADGLVTQGDPRLLRVVLDNLLGNAWKFTSKKSHARIEFGASGDNGKVAFFVRDNGAGFDMAYAGKLFGAFQRLHTVTEFEGTGIGLATVQRIVHRHGGRVWAEGKANEGATIFFTL